MDEITNKNIYDKNAENFNKVFKETFDLTKQNEQLIEAVDNVNTNVRNLFNMMNELKKEIEELKKK